jgi:hypothetical protein
MIGTCATLELSDGKSLTAPRLQSQLLSSGH